MEVPGETDLQVVVVVIARMVVVDVPAIGVEVADIDTVTIGRNIACAHHNHQRA